MTVRKRTSSAPCLSLVTTSKPRSSRYLRPCIQAFSL